MRMSRLLYHVPAICKTKFHDIYSHNTGLIQRQYTIEIQTYGITRQGVMCVGLNENQYIIKGMTCLMGHHLVKYTLGIKNQKVNVKYFTIFLRFNGQLRLFLFNTYVGTNISDAQPPAINAILTNIYMARFEWLHSTLMTDCIQKAHSDLCTCTNTNILILHRYLK